MESKVLQQNFFDQLKQKLPAHLSLVDEVAELLNISPDSAYRRIRGEKMLAFDEVQKLCTQYNLSIDHLLQLKNDNFIFSGRITNSSDFTFEHWMGMVVQHLENIRRHDPRHLYYLAKEIPFFYYYLLPEIAAFKSFFFMKSILYYDAWKGAKFSISDDYSRYHETWQKISDTYASIPSTEIWSIENITSTLHQVEFYRVTGALKTNEDALVLLDKFSELIAHLEKQAECGVKLRLGQDPATSKIRYNMFTNEIIMGDNMQLIQLGDTIVTYINHSVLNFVYTTDASFNRYMKATLDNLTHKSTPISETNEKERLLFFNRMRAKVQAAKNHILQNP